MFRLKRLRRFLPLLVFAALVGGGMVLSSRMQAKAREQELQTDLYEAERSLSLVLPRQVNAVTRLDRVQAGPGKRLTYHLTLLGPEGHMDAESFQKKLGGSIREEARSAPQYQPWLRQGVELVYRYYDDNGTFIDQVVVTLAR